MSETPWTPGPWEARASFRGIDTVIELPSSAPPINCGRHYTRVVAKLDGGDSSEWTANARLIASAPEMAELLEDARKAICVLRSILDTARLSGVDVADGLLADVDALLSRIKGDEQDQ